ncbi:outer membrane protein OmpU [Albidovulum inexpectatum]|uniref:Outer membrane protein OmpU n=1 Tax=Albidovulum inexpectatum TaxID=196587 RepID=A0A2S5JE85_9RHOB|nr:porin [Albidovulum inexpectatum]PPB79688.1 outer membrane protein OmpU [Albidovulum inexpectatum]
MKKILLATTALVGFAGAAAAEVSISGSAVFGIGFSENGAANPFGSTDEAYAIFETYLTFKGTTQSDNGLEFGYSSTIAAYDTDGGLNDDGTSAYVSGAFGKLTFGSVNEASKVAGLPDIGGLSGLGVDNVAEALWAGASHNVNYKYSAGAFTVEASSSVGKGVDSNGVGVKYDTGTYYVGLGYADDTEATTVYAGGSFSGVNVKAMYSDSNTANQKAWGIYADYTTGALTLKAEYADNDIVTDAAFGIGASYDLGGGAALVGGIASVDDNTRAEMGVSFEF